MYKTEWLLCPVCKNKTRIKLRQDTVLDHLPLYCPKCKQATLIHVKQFKAIPAGINEEMLACADRIAEIDQKMQDMYRRIKAAEGK